MFSLIVLHFLCLHISLDFNFFIDKLFYKHSEKNEVMKRICDYKGYIIKKT